MIFPAVDPQEWAKQWGITPAPIECRNCGKSFTPCIPAALKGYRGLVCEPHECGLEYHGSMFKPIGETLKTWMKILS